MAETYWKITPDLLEWQSVLDLAEVLHESRHAAGMYVALLYAFGVGNADDSGSINDYHDRKIENICRWNGKRGGLIEAFCASGILIGDADGRSEDDPLRIAGWTQLAAAIIEGRKQARERQNKSRGKKRKVTGGVTCDGTCDGTCETVNSKTTELQNSKTPKRGNIAGDGTQMEPRWNPPTPEEVRRYMDEYASGRGLCVDTVRASERFCNHYAEKGWNVQHWKPLAANWIDDDARKQSNAAQSNPALDYEQRKLTDEDFAVCYIPLDGSVTP